MIVAWLPFPGALTNGEGRVFYVDKMGILPVMAKKRRRTFGTVVRLRSGRIAGF